MYVYKQTRRTIRVKKKERTGDGVTIGFSFWWWFYDVPISPVECTEWIIYAIRWNVEKFKCLISSVILVYFVIHTTKIDRARALLDSSDIVFLSWNYNINLRRLIDLCYYSRMQCIIVSKEFGWKRSINYYISKLASEIENDSVVFVHDISLIIWLNKKI